MSYLVQGETSFIIDLNRPLAVEIEPPEDHQEILFLEARIFAEALEEHLNRFEFRDAVMGHHYEFKVRIMDNYVKELS